MKKKKCFKCGRVLPLTEFYKHSQMADGHLNKCKDCAKRDAIKTRNDNIEYYRKYDRGRANNKERVAARNAYYEKCKNDGTRKLIDKIRIKKYHNSYPERYRAKAIVGYAVRRGILERKPCERCGNQKAEAHHPDYSKPLDVIWLCHKCHCKEHARLREIARNDRT